MFKYLLFFIYTLNLSYSAEDKLLDKIVAVFTSNIISQSELHRIKATLVARNEISPLIYRRLDLNLQEILDIKLRVFIIRDKLNQLGYVIGDDSVEQRVQMTEQRLGLRRSDLLDFLKSKSLSFEEYFEIIRETMEFNIFGSRIISPLIAVTEQEIKTEFYKKFQNTQTTTYRYKLKDFIYPADLINEERYSELLNAIQSYKEKSIIPTGFSQLSSYDLDDLSEDSLQPEIKKTLENTSAGQFSKPVIINNQIHVFFVISRNVEESQEYTKLREVIQDEIFNQKGQAVTDSWFEREFENYFIKKYI